MKMPKKNASASYSREFQVEDYIESVLQLKHSYKLHLA